MAKAQKPHGEDLISKLLNSRNILDRLDAVDILLKEKNKTKLLELIHSESWHLRDKVKRALCAFGKEILPDIRPLLEERFWYVRSAAIYIIGEVGEAEDFDKIRHYINSKNRTVRQEASVAVVKLIKKYPSLREKLTQDDLVLLENNLKEFKEFDLLDVILKVGE